MNALSRRRFLSASAAVALTGGLRPPLAKSAEDKFDTAKLVAGNTAFGCDLYGRLKSEAGSTTALSTPS